MIPALAALLDGLSVVTAQRSQVYRFMEWGTHLNQRIYSAKVGVGEAMLTLREIANPNANADMGGGASKNKQSVDIMLSFAEGDDLTGPAAAALAMTNYRKAVVNAVKTIIHANEKTVAGTTFVQITNTIRNADELVGDLGVGNLRCLVIVTVEGEMHEVYA